MLSAQTLNRVSSSYRKGYYNGYFGEEYAEPKPLTNLIDAPRGARAIHAFADYDYRKGYHAGANDRYCHLKHYGGDPAEAQRFDELRKLHQ